MASPAPFQPVLAAKKTRNKFLKGLTARGV
jgi:hypothetical protein